MRKGELAPTNVVIRLIVEPIWAGPSLRTIFINKNMAGYCGYIGLISFVVYRPANAASDAALTVAGGPLRPARSGARAAPAADNASDDMPMTRRHINAKI
ncbi:hypothetical protein [Paraburkholderia phenoliruptrix]|uniref:hypothetical protein n=1 Tax=Paraburkholderia phenoliruptrix TaxID=252970 RepID=UPI001C6EFACA|nr:hypothetical protein [Paraburkholderia phenoliruptrix]MBW9104410.1 hypothetical protein [Paraburkholderia phenoliruptrix]MBW9129266.1 hypothetical protein [Paraburkholderia ginsengiterrae]